MKCFYLLSLKYLVSHLKFSRFAAFIAVLLNRWNNFASELNPIWIKRVKERKGEKESTHAYNFRDLYTCLNEWDNVRGKCMACSISYTRYTVRGVRKMRRKEESLLVCVRGGIAIFRAEFSYQEKQQVKGFRPAFFYRRRIFLGGCKRT